MDAFQPSALGKAWAIVCMKNNTQEPPSKDRQASLASKGGLRKPVQAGENYTQQGISHDQLRVMCLDGVKGERQTGIMTVETPEVFVE